MRKGISDISRQTAAKVKELFAAGNRKSTIAREIGISRSSVTRIVGITRHKVHPFCAKRAVALYVRHKMQQNQIASLLGVSTAFVCNSLRGIPKRPRPKKAVVIVEGKVTKVLKRKTGPKPKIVEEKPEPKIFKMRPAIKEGTRPVLIKPGLVVHAPVSEPVESVRARYLSKLASK